MKLNVLERLVVLSVLPAEGDYITLKILRELRESLSFSEEEVKLMNIKNDGATTTWDTKAEPPEGKEVNIGDVAKKIISDALAKLDREKKLKDIQLGIYEKFIG